MIRTIAMTDDQRCDTTGFDDTTGDDLAGFRPRAGSTRRNSRLAALCALGASTLLLAACGAGGTEKGADGPVAPSASDAGASVGTGDGTSAASDGGAAKDDVPTEASGGPEAKGEGEGEGGEAGEDGGEEDAPAAVSAPDPLPLNGYGPGVAALVQNQPGSGATISAADLTTTVNAAITNEGAFCGGDMMVGSGKVVECATGNDEISYSVLSVNISEGSSDVLIFSGNLPEQMIAESQKEQSKTVVSELSWTADDGKTLRDDDMRGTVNAAFPGAGGPPEYEALSCRGVIGAVDAGDEYEYTAASCAGVIQKHNATTFRVANTQSASEKNAILVVASLDDQK